jgi:hypothetical protein
MRKVLGFVRSIIGRIWGLLLLLRWPILASKEGKLLPHFEGRRFKSSGEPFIITFILRLPWKSDKRLVLIYHRFEVTDFALIFLSIGNLLAMSYSQYLIQGQEGVKAIGVVLVLSALAILGSIADRDGGKFQTAVLTVCLLAYSLLFISGDVFQFGPFAVGSWFILCLQFVVFPLIRWWQSRGDNKSEVDSQPVTPVVEAPAPKPEPESAAKAGPSIVVLHRPVQAPEPEDELDDVFRILGEPPNQS